MKTYTNCPNGNTLFFPRFYFFVIYFIDYAITVVPFPAPLYSSPPCTPLPTHIPPFQFMSMDHTYKFFGFSISHTILNLPLSILYLTLMLLIPCEFSLILPLHLPVDNPSGDLYFCESFPVLVVCLVCFCFCFRCGC